MGFRTGLETFWADLGTVFVPFDEVILGPEEVPMAEFVLVDRAELPESDVALIRRVLTGIRDCELRLGPAERCVGEVISAAGDIVDACIPKVLAVDGFAELPEKSLRVLRCIPGG